MKRSPQTDTGSSPGEPAAKTPKASPSYKQAYRKEWESMPDFKGWLRGVVGNPRRAYCKVCSKTLHAHRLSLLKHMVTLKHTTEALRKYKLAAGIHEDTPTSTFERQVSVIPSIIPIVTLGETQASARTKVKAEHPPALLKDMESDNLVIHDKTAETSEDKEASICEKSNNDNSEKSTETHNLAKDSDETPVASTSSSLNNNKEEQSAPIPSDHPDTIQPPPPLLIKESLAAKAAKPVTEYPISTHVLDTAKGTPVGNLHVSLYKLVDGRWTSVGDGITTPDGRCNSFLRRKDFEAGRYKIHFDVDRYFEIRKQDTLYPFIEIVFDARSSKDHYHIPVLLSPFGYTTYRGS